VDEALQGALAPGHDEARPEVGHKGISDEAAARIDAEVQQVFDEEEAERTTAPIGEEREIDSVFPLLFNLDLDKQRNCLRFVGVDWSAIIRTLRTSVVKNGRKYPGRIVSD
jgi:hypothetical protein